MAPGLTSPGGNMDEVKEGQIVAVMAEGKRHAMGLGRMIMSSDQIREENKGEAIELILYIRDAMWPIVWNQ